MGFGVPAGAKMPIQLLTSKPGNVSATVGTSGSELALLLPITAKAFNLSVLT